MAKRGFEGYEGEYRDDYKGKYKADGFRFPAVSTSRTWDIVRIDADSPSLHRSGTFTVVSSGYDMMGKAYRQFRAAEAHFRTCVGEDRCGESGHPRSYVGGG